jgi:Protein of unknown function (DUF3572)
LKEPLTRERAEILALEALAWLAGQPDAIAKFLTLSGLEASDLRRAVTDSGLQTSVLDFLLGDEGLLLEFCESASLKPPAVHTARYRLGG